MKRLVAVALLILLAGCLDGGSPEGAPASTPDAPATSDPLVAGPHKVSYFEYDFGQLVVHDPTLGLYQYNVPMHGSLHLPDGDGLAPFVALMHGRHVTCDYAGVQFLGPGTCPETPATDPVDSYTGYDGLAELLASHGYAVISIDANTINDRDLAGDAGANARGELALRTLEEFKAINATGAPTGELDGLPIVVPGNAPATSIPEAKGRLDLSRIGVMGHSRGGEGMLRAAGLNDDRGRPHNIVALFALAPTDFARWPLPDFTAFATLLPYCDGDVSNLQGGWMYDDARAAIADGRTELLPGQVLAQVVARGANHNFYNTVWTGDDNGGSTDAWCGPDEDSTGRDTPESERAHGYGLMASFFRLFVGDEQVFRDLWEGHKAWPATMCPEHDGCDDRLLTSVFHPPRPTTALLSLDGLGSTVQGEVGSCTPPDCPGQPTYTIAKQTALAPGASVRYAAPAGVLPQHVSFRAGVPVGDADASLTVTFTGAEGSVVVPVGDHATLRTPPGESGTTGDAKTLLSMIQIPVPADLRDSLQSVTLTLGEGGGLQVADVQLFA